MSNMRPTGESANEYQYVRVNGPYSVEPFNQQGLGLSLPGLSLAGSLREALMRKREEDYKNLIRAELEGEYADREKQIIDETMQTIDDLSLAYWGKAKERLLEMFDPNKISGGLSYTSYGYKLPKTGYSVTKGDSPYGLQRPFWDALSKANMAMKRAGLGTFSVNSGYRSYAGQVDAKKRHGNLAATPGSSVHGIGLAADLSLTKKQYEWLKKNGHKFGLVNLPGESWHWQLSTSAWRQYLLSAPKQGSAGPAVQQQLPGIRPNIKINAGDPSRDVAGNSAGLHPELYNRIAAASEAMRRSGLGRIVINSGYRSMTDQAVMKSLYPDRFASPGASKHNYGLAADLALTDKQYRWLKENGRKFGLYQPDPKERWHWEAL